MTLGGQGAQSSGSADLIWRRRSNPLTIVASFAKKTLAVAEADARKLYHDPSELITRSIQPMLWLLVFGQVFTRTRVLPTGDRPYIDFMAPGILAQSVLFISIFYGISIIWERDLGILHKFLVSPTPRVALVLGKALAAGIRSLAQAVIVYILALIVGVEVNKNPLALAGVLMVIVLGAAFFSTLSLIIACVVKTRERFMGIGQVLTMPMFFASNAIYPIEIMPAWLRIISHINPLTYEVDALRTLMLRGWTSSYGLGLDLAILAGATALLIAIGARLYPKVAV